LYGSCVSLSNGKQNASTSTSCHRIMGMWLYKQGWKMPKWKDLKTFNIEIQVKVYVGGVGVKEGIGLGWSQGFGLDECMTRTLMMS
jgi:hypothetical protein